MVNTFLPFADFEKTARVLDSKRLLKQRVEAYQIILALQDLKHHSPHPSHWIYHPATLMWKGYLSALKLYYNTMIKEVKRRGFHNSMKLFRVSSHPTMPWWMGYPLFHHLHQASLLRKQPEHYIRYFKPTSALLWDYFWASRVTPQQKRTIIRYLECRKKKKQTLSRSTRSIRCRAPYTYQDLVERYDEKKHEKNEKHKKQSKPKK